MNNKSLSACILFLLTLLTIVGLIFTQDLTQRNKETLFLTSEGIENYQIFSQQFSEKNFVVFKKDYVQTLSQYDLDQFDEHLQKLKQICQENCSLVGPADLKVEQQTDPLIKLQGPRHLAALLIGINPHFPLQTIIHQMKHDSYWKNAAFSGVPYTNYHLDQYSKNVKETLFPILFGGIFLLTFVLCRSFSVGLLLYIPALLSASLSLSAIKLYLGQSNLILAIIPLLLFVINYSLILHIYYMALEVQSLRLAIKKKKTPVMLMVLTTFIGFFSLYFSNLRAIALFGIITSFLILSSSFVTVIWLYFAHPFLSYSSTSRSDVFFKLKKYFTDFISYKMLFTLSIIGVILGSFLFTKLPVITDATLYFPEKSGLKKSIDQVSQTVVGPPILEIILQTKQTPSIEILKRLDRMEEQIQSVLSKESPHTKILSLNQLVKTANYQYTKEKKIPDFFVAYTTLVSQIPLVIREGHPLKNYYRLTLLSPPTNVDKYEQLIGKLEMILKNSDLEYQFNGLYYHLMVAQKEMIQTLFKSFISGLIVIAIVAFMAFRKTKIFFIFLFVNIVPVFISFVFLYIFNISLNIATVMTYSISLGIIVDSSFHLIHGLDDPMLNQQKYYQTLVRPILGSTILLSICFSLFGLNDFLPIQEFGISLSIILILGLFFDLKILPRLYKGRDYSLPK